ncbi:MAG: RIP metalloprotease RseP [Parvibaculaceae bacterium]
MDLLTGLGNFGASAGGYIIPFLFVLTVVVFFHELGHFLVARWCGVKVDVFSIGFGREVFGRYDKHGTRWKLSWIPLGGYVKFAGDDNAASMPDKAALSQVPLDQRAGLFFFKRLHQRAAVVAAGPFANFILSIVIYSLVFGFVGRGTLLPVVGSVVAGSPAEAAGLMPDDRIMSINGSAINDFKKMTLIIKMNPGVPLDFGIERKSAPLHLTVTPKLVELKDELGNNIKVGQIGLGSKPGEDGYKFERLNPIESVVAGTSNTWFVVTSTLQGIGGMLTGHQDPKQLGGIITIADLSGKVAKSGFANLLELIAVLSVSIGLLNLFPVPMLDGGHLLYYAIEGIKGRPLGEKAQEFGFRVGLALVMMLMIFATWNDLVRLFSGWLW